MKWNTLILLLNNGTVYAQQMQMANIDYFYNKHKLRLIDSPHVLIKRYYELLS